MSHEPASDHNSEKTDSSTGTVFGAIGVLFAILLIAYFAGTTKRGSSNDPSNEGNSTYSSANGGKDIPYSYNSYGYTQINVPGSKAVDFFNATTKHRMHRLHQTEQDDLYGDVGENLSSQFPLESADNYTFFIKATVPGEEGTILIHIEPKTQK